MGKQPQGQNQRHGDDDNAQTLHVHIGAGDDEGLVAKDRQGIFKAHISQIAEHLEDDQADTESGDHFGERLALDTHQYESVHEGPEQGSTGHRDQHRCRIGQFGQMGEHPDPVGGHDIEGAISKISHTADAESQIEPHGGDGQNGAVDNGINDRSNEHCDSPE